MYMWGKGVLKDAQKKKKASSKQQISQNTGKIPPSHYTPHLSEKVPVKPLCSAPQLHHPPPHPQLFLSLNSHNIVQWCSKFYLQVLFSVKDNGFGFDLSVLDVDLIATKHDGNVLTDTHQVTMPVWNIFVCHSWGHIKHDDGTVPWGKRFTHQQQIKQKQCPCYL